MKLGDGKFKGSTEAFLDHLNSQFDLYEELTQVTIDDKQRIQHVSRAVSSVPKLAAIETTAELLATNTGKAFTYTDYFALLHSAAVWYDDDLKAQRKRMVYSHDTTYGGQYDDLDESPWNVYEANLHHMLTNEDISYDVDTPVSVIQANAVDQRRPRRPPGVSMPKERSIQLDYKAKRIWDQLPDESKSMILGYLGKGDTGRPPPDRLSSNPRPIIESASTTIFFCIYCFLFSAGFIILAE